MAASRRKTTVASLSAPLFAPKPVAGTLRAQVLASSSAGNCTFVTDGETHLLIDAGISGRRTLSALRAHGLSTLEPLAGVLLTHSHGDHIGQLPSLQKYHPEPERLVVWGSQPTLNRLETPADARTLRPGRAVQIGAMVVTPVGLSHDSPGCVGYLIERGRQALAVVTDTGFLTDEATWALSQATTAILEMNYCPRLLRTSRRPMHNIRRVVGEHGHLQNEHAVAGLMAHADPTKLTRVLPAHLSRDHNHPDVAMQVLTDALTAAPAFAHVRARLTHRDQPTPLFDV